MVTLATAVNANATTWHLSAPLPTGTEYIQVDDELVAVITPAIRPSQREEPTLFCEVLRGAAGDQTSHSQGATLTTLENPPLGGGDASEAVVLKLTTTLTNAQVLALTSTPVTVVPSPGAGQAVIPLMAHLRCHAVVDYNGIATDSTLVLTVNNQVVGLIDNAVQNGVSGVLAPGDTEGQNAFVSLKQVVISKAPDSAALDSGLTGLYDGDLGDGSLKIALNDAGGIGGGNAGNTLAVSVYYVVVDIA